MLRGFWQLTWLELKIFLREPLGAIGTVALPVMVFLIFGKAAGPRLNAPPSDGLLQVPVPVLAAVLISISAVLSLVTIIAVYREGGILRRLRATPLRPQTILAAHVMVKLLLTALTLVALILAGRRWAPIGEGVPLVGFLLALLLSNGLNLLQRELLHQGELRINEFIALADASLASPLSQRDYATLQQTLDQIRQSSAIKYVVLLDHRGSTVAASGWADARPLPPVDDGLGSVDLDRADHCVHAERALAFAGQTLGTLRFGFSTEFLLEARRQMLREDLPIAAAAVVLTIALLASIGLLLTRQLTALHAASQRLSSGDFDASVPIVARDDIGRLSQSFNAMAAAIKQRVGDLQRSEQLQRQHLTAARAEHDRLVSLLEAMDSGILFLDADDRVLYTNPAFARIWRLPRDYPLAERSVDAIVDCLLPALGEHAASRADLLRAAPQPGVADLVELRAADDRTIVQRQHVIVDETQRITGRLVIHDDATTERRNLQRAQLAERDALTDMLNRRGLHDALVAAVGDADREESSAALFFIDLDDFKYTNDTFGHRIGDELLRAAAKALSAELRRGELVARIGGDEFAVLCPGVDAAIGAAIAPRLVQAVSQLRMDAGGHELRVGCSVGMAVYPEHAANADDLIVCADLAMYQAKRAGKNGWSVYRDDVRQSDAESAHMRWNTRIAHAIDKGLFRLEFQTVHRASDRSVAHHEALLRMLVDDDPSLLIAPGEFVPYAERSGKIRQIDRWVPAGVATVFSSPHPPRSGSNTAVWISTSDAPSRLPQYQKARTRPSASSTRQAAWAWRPGRVVTKRLWNRGGSSCGPTTDLCWNEDGAGCSRARQNPAPKATRTTPSRRRSL